VSDTVLADAQFSVARIFRPFEGFEGVYSGQSVETPIAIPGNLDPNAGKTGFDANLLAGIPMPMGAKAILWFPTIFNFDISAGLTIQPYKYTILWRLRNLRDFRVDRAPYHFPQQSLGEDSKFVIPSAVNPIISEQMLVSSSTGGSSPFAEKRLAPNEVGIEYMTFRSAIANAPLTPAGNAAAFQQGLAQGTVGSNRTVTFNPVQIDVIGDEMIILVNREANPTAGSVWDFEFADQGFSAFFGTADGSREIIDAMGIYVFTGSNP
jgi:hypothetical protein